MFNYPAPLVEQVHSFFAFLYSLLDVMNRSDILIIKYNGSISRTSFIKKLPTKEEHPLGSYLDRTIPDSRADLVRHAIKKRASKNTANSRIDQ